MKNLGDRYPIQETPESAQEFADLKQAAYERAIEHADILRDELRDRKMDEIETAHNVRADSTQPASGQPEIKNELERG